MSGINKSDFLAKLLDEGAYATAKMRASNTLDYEYYNGRRSMCLTLMEAYFNPKDRDYIIRCMREMADKLYPSFHR